MKKIGLFLALIISSIILMSCKNKNEIDISNVEPFYMSGIKVTPETAKLEDSELELRITWKRGTDEDSMNRTSFLSSGILFSAEQNGTNVEWDIKDSEGMAKEVYEASESTIYPKFILNNLTDNVIITMFNGTDPDNSKKIELELPK